MIRTFLLLLPIGLFPSLLLDAQQNRGSGPALEILRRNLPDEPWISAQMLVDWDADGDLDLLTARADQGMFESVPSELVLYQNDGEASFSPGTRYLLPLGTGASAGATGDVDGDLDVFNGVRTFTNLARSLSWEALPRIGRPLVFKLGGVPHRPYKLFASLGLDPIHFPRRGYRQIDVDLVFFATHGYLDVDGRAERTFQIPDDPALVGVSVYWQALIGAPQRWSNLEVTTPVDH